MAETYWLDRPASTTTRPPPRRDPLAQTGETWRWAKAFAAVLGVHALPVLIAVYWLGPPISAPSPEPAIMIDMEPPAATPEPPSELPPGPQQVQADTPQPRIEREVVETPLVPNPVVSIPARPPEPPRQQARVAAPETTAPQSSLAPRAPRTSSGQVGWQSLVLGHLDRNKRYPREAQFARQQGVPYIRFVMNRDGRVLSSTLERSSGFRSLDAEAVALPRRAQPLPKPPDDVAGERIELVVPIEFFIRWQGCWSVTASPFSYAAPVPRRCRSHY